MMPTIDVTPSWEGIMPGLIAVLENVGASVEARSAVRDELMRLARAVDSANVVMDEALGEGSE